MASSAPPQYYYDMHHYSRTIYALVGVVPGGGGVNVVVVGVGDIEIDIEEGNENTNNNILQGGSAFFPEYKNIINGVWIQRGISI